MAAPKEVLELVQRFQRNRETYENPHFNETETRIQFLNPLFTALGWDVDNTAGYAEAYKDVIHEDAVKVGGATKAPDYCFAIGGARKFFLEAKKPSVNVKNDANPAFQLRRYAWSAKLPLSVLSNFGELAVYDCRARPDKDDKASKGRIQYWECEQYAEKWDEIASIFSKDAILKGSFDKFAITSRNKRGTAEVDDEFLNEIEDWRDLLAKNTALRNPKISQRELNFAVQQTIDRIIFLRICEDRGIEPYGRLQALQNGENVYERLKTLFHQADDRYNSGLFHFREERDRKQPPDELTLSLTIDDKPLKDIFKRLYYPDSPYEFSVLTADILGQVYE
ncbi:MAG: type I restriction endonuclease, partial [Rhodanobacter sp.]